MFFVNLIYGHFDILMFQNGQIKKVALSQVCAIVVNSPILQGRRTQIPPKHIPSPYISMNTTQIPIDTPPEHPSDTPRHLQGTQEVNRWKQTPTDIKRHPQTPSDTVRCCLSMSGSVCMGHDVVCWHFDFLGDVWGVFRGRLGVSEWYSGNQMCFRG